jgi:7-cyano-7-deazaguanine reductase
MTNVIHSPLGKPVEYAEFYDPSLLFPISRAEKRREIGIMSGLPFHGVDWWTAYEISCLNEKGKPLVAIGEFSIPADSPNIIESKSLKLYLNSFNQTRLGSLNELRDIITTDLSQACGKPVLVNLLRPQAFSQCRIAELEGLLIDDLDVAIDDYQPAPQVLKTENIEVTETLVSNLLKSNCLITQQPDWASIQIHYTGPKIVPETLLQYLVSLRQHNEFHEPCVERIFMILQEYCQPKQLSVYARYTRRGGLDINPFRSNFATTPHNIRTARQ